MTTIHDAVNSLGDLTARHSASHRQIVEVATEAQDADALIAISTLMKYEP